MRHRVGMRARRRTLYDYSFDLIGVVFTLWFIALADRNAWSLGWSILMLIAVSLPVALLLLWIKRRLALCVRKAPLPQCYRLQRRPLPGGMDQHENPDRILNDLIDETIAPMWRQFASPGDLAFMSQHRKIGRARDRIAEQLVDP